jgi:hypothetical protein
MRTDLLRPVASSPRSHGRRGGIVIVGFTWLVQWSFKQLINFF